MRELILNGFQCYTISENGNIYDETGKEIKQTLYCNYMNVRLQKSSYIKTEKFRVDYLVAKTYIGKIDNMTVHHKDFNKLNNNVSNLEIMTINEHLSVHQQGSHKIRKTIRKIKQSLKKTYANR